MAYLLSLYPYPNLKRLVLSSHLYLPNLLKHNSVAENCVDNIIRIHVSERLPKTMYLEAMLEKLRDPAPAGVASPLD